MSAYHPMDMTNKSTMLVGALTLCVAGCGYSSRRPFPTVDGDQQPIRTVSVEIFQSQEFRRGLELLLAESLSKRIEAETPYRLARREHADTLLTGEIKEVRQGTIGRDFRRNRPRETTATFVIAFQWKSLRSGRILVNRPNFVQTVDYVRPLSEDFHDAGQEAMDKLAERMIEQLESDW